MQEQQVSAPKYQIGETVIWKLYYPSGEFQSAGMGTIMFAEYTGNEKIPFEWHYQIEVLNGPPVSITESAIKYKAPEVQVQWL